MAARLKAPVRRGAAAVALSLAVGALTPACDVFTSVGPKSCNQSEQANVPVDYTAGTVENGIYMSSPWDKDLLYFPGGMQIRIVHHLGMTPRLVRNYLSFDETGTKASTVAEAAGNQVELTEVNDQDLIVKNGSCSDYWLIVTAQ